MNKKKAFKSMWIDFNDRLPPDTDEEILIHIDMIGCNEVTQANIARNQHIQMQKWSFKKKIMDDQNILKKTGYFADKWMKIYNPK